MECRISELEIEIANLEFQINAFNIQLADAAARNDLVRLSELNKSIMDSQAKIEGLTKEWEETTETLESAT